MNTMGMGATGEVMSSLECGSDALVGRVVEHSNAALVMAGDAGEEAAGSKKTVLRLRTGAKAQSLRVAIKVRGKILFINLGDVVAVEAEGKCVWLRQKASSYLLRESISVVAERLESHGFIRIHRSMLVNASFVEEIWPLSTGEYCLRAEGGKEYTVTRTYKKNLQALAEFWIGTGALFPG